MHLTTTAVTLARKAFHRHQQAKALTATSVKAFAQGDFKKAERYRNKAIRKRVWAKRYEQAFTIRYGMEKAEKSGMGG